MLEIYRKKLDNLKGQRDKVQSDLNKAGDELAEAKLQSIYCEEAILTIQHVAKKTQESLEMHISGLGDLALSSVFDDPFSFKVEFTPRRGRTEVDFWLEGRKGDRVNPKLLGCGGELDLISYALRPSLWKIMPRQTYGIFFMDEPLKWLKGGDLPKRGAEFISDSCKKMDPPLQVVMISHITEQIEHADRKIFLTMKNEVSQVKIV